MFSRHARTNLRLPFVFILVLFSAFHYAEAQRVLLRDVQTLTLYRGQYTTGRRSSPVSQLQCIGGTAAGKYSPKAVQCYNRGFDGRDVQWECKSELSDDFQFGKITVTCEGFDYPDDPYILAGSCGLEYELDYTVKGAQRHGRKTPSAPFYDVNEKSWWDASTIIYIIIAAFIIYLVYSIITGGDQAGGHRAGAGGSGFDDNRPGYPPGNPPPPGWFGRPPSAPPSYDESTSFGKSAPYSSTSQSSGPGFFTGLGLGTLGGYLWGNSGTGTYRRRHYGPNQFERDTGFYDSSYDRPSTSYSSSPGPSSSSHTSSGYGGTSRR